MFRIQPVKLHDCQVHGGDSGAELFLVEGDSASKAVCRARDPRTQAVLPMQGKPLNAIRASKQAVGRNELLSTLISALGAGWDAECCAASLRYQRVILLFDGDADGIHCGALMTMFFFRWMRPLLAQGRIEQVRPPLYEIASTTTSDTLHAYNDDHYQRLREELERREIPFKGKRYRGLASMNADVLQSTCLHPASRNVHPLTCEDAEAAIRIFMGSQPAPRG